MFRLADRRRTTVGRMDDTAEPVSSTGLSKISFGDVVIDLQNYEIVRAGDLVSVEPQVFDVLRYLVENRDRVVSKEELLDNVWGDRFVSESALTSRIKSARQAVGDDGRKQEVIRTTHGRGYRFVAEASAAAPAAPRLTGAEPSAPQRSASVSITGKVPVPARPLVARDHELAALVGLLEANRLVTVVGPGGVGKTRLATEVALRWDQESDDAVSFAALASVSSPSHVMDAVRDALGVDSGHIGRLTAVHTERVPNRVHHVARRRDRGQRGERDRVV